MIGDYHLFPGSDFETGFDHKLLELKGSHFVEATIWIGLVKRALIVLIEFVLMEKVPPQLSSTKVCAL